MAFGLYGLRVAKTPTFAPLSRGGLTLVALKPSLFL